MFSLAGRNQGADFGVRIEAPAQAEGPDPLDEAFGQRLRYPLVDEEASAGRADLSLVAEGGPHGPFDGRLEVGVVQDDVGGLAAELERQPLQGSGSGPLDLLPDGGRSREGNLVHSVVFDKVGPGPPVSGDHVEHAGWEPRLQRQLGQADGRQR